MQKINELQLAKELIRFPTVTPVDAGVMKFLENEKPPMTHVVLTGRNAAEDLIEMADLVTEMALVKHPFRSGIKAQIGVEF